VSRLPRQFPLGNSDFVYDPGGDTLYVNGNAKATDTANSTLDTSLSDGNTKAIDSDNSKAYSSSNYARRNLNADSSGIDSRRNHGSNNLRQHLRRPQPQLVSATGTVLLALGHACDSHTSSSSSIGDDNTRASHIGGSSNGSFSIDNGSSSDLHHDADTSRYRSDNGTTCAAHTVDPTSPLNLTPVTRLALNVAPPLHSADVLQAICPTNSKGADASHCQKKASKAPRPPQTPSRLVRSLQRANASRATTPRAHFPSGFSSTFM
jgi:hypothetical protein